MHTTVCLSLFCVCHSLVRYKHSASLIPWNINMQLNLCSFCYFTFSLWSLFFLTGFFVTSFYSSSFLHSMLLLLYWHGCFPCSCQFFFLSPLLFKLARHSLFCPPLQLHSLLLVIFTFDLIFINLSLINPPSSFTCVIFIAVYLSSTVSSSSSDVVVSSSVAISTSIYFSSSSVPASIVFISFATTSIWSPSDVDENRIEDVRSLYRRWDGI